MPAASMVPNHRRRSGTSVQHALRRGDSNGTDDDMEAASAYADRRLNPSVSFKPRTNGLYHIRNGL